MVDGIAGENIIIAHDQEVWADDIGGQIAIESQKTNQLTLLDLVSYASPCDEFSHFAVQSQSERLPAPELKATLQFLDNGRRGFLFLLRDGQESALVQAGDRVFAIQA